MFSLEFQQDRGRWFEIASFDTSDELWTVLRLLIYKAACVNTFRVTDGDGDVVPLPRDVELA